MVVLIVASVALALPLWCPTLRPIVYGCCCASSRNQLGRMCDKEAGNVWRQQRLWSKRTHWWLTQQPQEQSGPCGTAHCTREPQPPLCSRPLPSPGEERTEHVLPVAVLRKQLHTQHFQSSHSRTHSLVRRFVAHSREPKKTCRAVVLATAHHFRQSQSAQE